MRYYLGNCEYKWKHAESHMEPIWIQREVGSKVYKYIEENNWEWKLVRSESKTIPGDIYCRCDIYVDLPFSKAATMFVLKHPRAKLVKVL